MNATERAFRHISHAIIATPLHGACVIQKVGTLSPGGRAAWHSGAYRSCLVAKCLPMFRPRKTAGGP
jgi:hypothetical protein